METEREIIQDLATEKLFLVKIQFAATGFKTSFGGAWGGGGRRRGGGGVMVE